MFQVLMNDGDLVSYLPPYRGGSVWEVWAGVTLPDGTSLGTTQVLGYDTHPYLSRIGKVLSLFGLDGDTSEAVCVTQDWFDTHILRP